MEIAKSLANIFEESDRLGSSSSTMEEDRLEIVRIYHQFPDLILNNIKWSNCVKQSLHLTAKLFLFFKLLISKSSNELFINYFII